MTLTPRTVPELIAEIDILTSEIQELYLQGNPFVVGWSGGKDSTTVLQLIWNAIKRLPKEQRKYPLYVITNDTLVENPIISAHVRNALKLIDAAAKEQNIPVMTKMTTPEIKNSFWVCLIGKGYAAPRQGFRWCTDKLKIRPAEKFINEVVTIEGQMILALGVREAESATRAASMEKQREFKVSERLNKNQLHVGSLTYSPIRSWRTDEVWLYLMQYENPWGCDNKDLFAIYRGATADNECPLVVDASTPSCGSSRFGCWTCTLVSKDKSTEAMIQNDEDKEWMQVLLDIRNELDVRDDEGKHADHDKRDWKGNSGKVRFYTKFYNAREEDNSTMLKPVPGPYIKFWREHWLRRVLEAQTQIRKTAPEEMRDITLITPEELSEIRRIWREEKHEFDDSLPRIYEQATGESFADISCTDERNALGKEEWDILSEICEEDETHFHLIASLLNETNKTHLKTRRKDVFKALEKCFDANSRSMEEAVASSHEKNKLTKTVESVKKEGLGELNKVKQMLNKDTPNSKQLSWADVKFAPSVEQLQ